MGKTAANKQLDNLAAHGDHIRAIAKGPAHRRNAILASASQDLVRALATACRLVSGKGFQPHRRHARRNHIMCSNNTAMRSKMAAVRGQPGKGSRGGVFFRDIGKALISFAPHLVPEVLSGEGFFGDVGNFFKHAGDFVVHSADKLSDEVTKMGDGVADTFNHMLDKGTKVATAAVNKAGDVATAAVNKAGDVVAQNPELLAAA